LLLISVTVNKRCLFSSSFINLGLVF
jgi:hypothetical protein